MIDFCYANTRIAGMRKRLMGRAATEQMLALPDVRTIVDHLLQSVYRGDLEEALKSSPLVRALDKAFSEGLAKTFDKLMKLYPDRGRDAILALVEEWDVRALKAVLRGVHRQAPMEQILAGTGPTAALRERHLRELAGVADVATVVKMLLDWSFPWGKALSEQLPGYDLDRRLEPLEAALDNRGIETRFSGWSVDARVAGDILSMAAEIVNIIACLTAMEEGKKPKLRPQGLRDPWLVNSLARAGSFDECIIVLSRSPYRMALDQVLPILIMKPGRYALLERRLEWQLLRHAKRHATIEPLSIATPYYYLCCKCNEVMNLRLIAHGIDAGVPRDSIRAGLVFLGKA